MTNIFGRVIRSWPYGECSGVWVWLSERRGSTTGRFELHEGGYSDGEPSCCENKFIATHGEAFYEHEMDDGDVIVEILNGGLGVLARRHLAERGE